MTGYGDVSTQVDGVHYTVELHSLNNRFFKAVLRLPEELAGLEAETEQQLRKKLNRGSIIATVRVRFPDAQSVHRVNDNALLAYMDHLETLHSKFSNPDQRINIDLTALLALPGVLQSAQDDQAFLEKAQPIIGRLLEEACDKLTAMRQAEGQAIEKDLAQQRQIIRRRLNEIIERAPAVVEDYHVRLKSRIDELLARAQLKVEEKELIHEVAVFAEKADISEEASRLASHLDHFEKVIADSNGQPAGRTLDFLAQEMLREANTIASKSNDSQISRAIVEVKGSIDRIKEQVQNVQ